MINAAVSHELRNPLNSMIGQLHYMNHNLGTLKQAMEIIKDESSRNHSLKQLSLRLHESYEGLRESGRSITNSAQLIDFFVHDILDYAVLKGKR